VNCVEKGGFWVMAKTSSKENKTTYQANALGRIGEKIVHPRNVGFYGSGLD
jgi:hypothetical protein